MPLMMRSAGCCADCGGTDAACETTSLFSGGRSIESLIGSSSLRTEVNSQNRAYEKQRTRHDLKEGDSVGRVEGRSARGGRGGEADLVVCCDGPLAVEDVLLEGLEF